MNIKEKQTFFIEFLGERDCRDEEYHNPNVQGERTLYRLISFHDISSEDFTPATFPEGCIAYKIRSIIDILNEDGITVRSNCRDVKGPISVAGYSTIDLSAPTKVPNL